MNGHLRWFTTVRPFRSDTLVCPRDKETTQVANTSAEG